MPELPYLRLSAQQLAAPSEVEQQLISLTSSVGIKPESEASGEQSLVRDAASGTGR